MGGFRRLEENNRIIEIIIKQRKHRISREQFEKYREELLRRRTRTAAGTMNLPPRGERGPNGGRIGYLPNGDKVQWVKEEDEQEKIIEWPLLLRRNDQSILAAYGKYWDKVWWNRHQNWKYRIQAGQEIVTKEQKALYRRASAPPVGSRKSSGRRISGGATSSGGYCLVGCRRSHGLWEPNGMSRWTPEAGGLRVGDAVQRDLRRARAWRKVWRRRSGRACVTGVDVSW